MNHTLKWTLYWGNMIQREWIFLNVPILFTEQRTRMWGWTQRSATLSSAATPRCNSPSTASAETCRLSNRWTTSKFAVTDSSLEHKVLAANNYLFLGVQLPSPWRTYSCPLLSLHVNTVLVRHLKQRNGFLYEQHDMAVTSWVKLLTSYRVLGLYVVLIMNPLL